MRLFKIALTKTEGQRLQNDLKEASVKVILKIYMFLAVAILS